MTTVTYAIVFNGEIVEGFQTISVKAHLAKLLKADAEKINLLFSGKAIVLKKTQDKSEAARYGSALKKVGANVRVRIIKNNPDQAAAPTAVSQVSPVKAPAAKTPVAKAPAVKAPVAKAPIAAPTNLSLAPNEGNLFDANPEVAAPDIDLSGLELGENDGSPIVEPKVYEKVEMDLSEYSVSENDGTPLVEAAPEVEKLEAPDFGLDVPGATLETLKEEVELLDPDTSGMSLAFPGTEILSPEEKDQGPPPKAPDTSSITLAPNRATF